MTSPPPKGRGWSAPARVGFSSVILWSARPFITTPRPLPGARSTGLWPTPFPTSRSTGGPGTWPSPCWPRTMPACSALEQAGARARERSAYDVASRAFERAAQLAPNDSWRGRLLFSAADSAWLGGLALRAQDLLEATATSGLTPELTAYVDNLKGHIAARLGRVGEGQVILARGAERVAAADPDRAVLMLAEVVNAAFYAGTQMPCAMRQGELPKWRPLLLDVSARSSPAWRVVWRSPCAGTPKAGPSFCARPCLWPNGPTSWQTTRGCWRGRPWALCACGRHGQAGS